MLEHCYTAVKGARAGDVQESAARSWVDMLSVSDAAGRTAMCGTPCSSTGTKGKVR